MAEPRYSQNDSARPLVIWAAVVVAAAIVGFILTRLFGLGWIGGIVLAVLVFAALGYLVVRGGGAALPTASGAQAASTPIPATPPPRPAPAAPPAPAPPAAAEPTAGEIPAAASAHSERVREAARAAAEAASGLGDPAGRVDAQRPAGLDGPREGGADDLKRIKGVGPSLEELLHRLGIFHFDQIAGWSEAELAWVDTHLEGFNGRATRDDWVGQAKILAAGGETEHSRRGDPGGSTSTPPREP
jgi:NADH-quinone oxidoreductase subunit E